MKKIIYGLLFCSLGLDAVSQCANSSNIYSFRYNGNQYEVVKEKRDWVSAAACATSRGGYLAEINSSQEQDSIFFQINQSGVTANQTLAPDGGNAGYLWLGGHDMSMEGRWIWDGNNSGNGIHFYQGARNGNSINGLYNNWGNEPDDFNNNQDGLAIAISSWPFGSTGQWNDVATSNQLFYVIEYSSSTGLEETKKDVYEIYPNPVSDQLFINLRERIKGKVSVKVFDMNGKVVIEEVLQSSIDISNLKSGNYRVQIISSANVLHEESLVIQNR